MPAQLFRSTGIPTTQESVSANKFNRDRSNKIKDDEACFQFLHLNLGFSKMGALLKPIQNQKRRIQGIDKLFIFITSYPSK